MLKDNNDIKKLKAPLAAILKHDIQDIKVNSASEPLVFLLMLCDLLQEWDRPRVDSSIFRQEVAANLIRPSMRDFESQTVLAGIEINTTLDVDYNMKLDDGKISFELIYKNAEETKVEPVITWLDASASLNRLENIPENLKIEIKMKHPIQDDLCGLEFTEKDMFHDFVNEKKADITTKIIPWIEAVNRPFSGMTYQHDETKKEEIFSIDLNVLSKADVDIKPHKDLFDKYVDWKKKFITTAKLKKMR
ncbi:MAG: hypothetical protein HQK99_00615 [Nitrospirae bacterium]|nr:hypothetical protein [Nitrospirota bacterium]